MYRCCDDQRTEPIACPPALYELAAGGIGSPPRLHCPRINGDEGARQRAVVATASRCPVQLFHQAISAQLPRCGERSARLGGQDSNLGMAESKSTCFSFYINAYFRKRFEFDPIFVIRLASISERANAARPIFTCRLRSRARRPHEASASSKALASFRSSVSKPSVNQP